MRDKKGFDEWAEEYEKNVNFSYDDKTYPFAGYKEVLKEIYNIITKKNNPIVLDMGFGTATLTKMLYDKGCIIYGQDFSDKMREIAINKMPNATLYVGDFLDGLHPNLQEKQFDFIVFTYSLHHINDLQKVAFLGELRKNLKPNGKILIGDVMFQNDEERIKCKKISDDFDDEEYYLIIDEFIKYYKDLHFQKMSFCSGVVIID